MILHPSRIPGVEPQLIHITLPKGVSVRFRQKRTQSESSEASASSFPSQRGQVLLPAMTTTDSSPVLSVVQTVEEQLAEIRAALARQNEIIAQRGAEIAAPKTQLNAAYRPPTSEEILA